MKPFVKKLNLLSLNKVSTSSPVVAKSKYSSKIIKHKQLVGNEDIVSFQRMNHDNFEVFNKPSTLGKTFLVWKNVLGESEEIRMYDFLRKKCKSNKTDRLIREDYEHCRAKLEVKLVNLKEQKLSKLKALELRLQKIIPLL